MEDRLIIIELIIEASENGARIFMACKEAGIAKRTYERWCKDPEDKRKSANRPDPKNKLSKEEYKSVVRILNSPEYADMPPAQIVITLADKGIYIASESTFYRILREEKLNAHRGKSRAPRKTKKPTSFAAHAPNEVWTWDITWLNSYTKGIYFKLYLILDIFSRKVVGWEVWDDENGELAAELMQRTVYKEKVNRKPLVLHSDNGAPMKSYTLKAKLEDMSIVSSYSRPRVSNDNPYSESQFKTLKYRPNYPHSGFSSIEKAREWVLEFVTWYNEIHYHSGINHLTPSMLHDGNPEKVMKKRIAVYNSAKLLNPSRFNNGIRNFKVPRVSYLNPEKDDEDIKSKIVS